MLLMYFILVLEIFTALNILTEDERELAFELKIGHI